MKNIRVIFLHGNGGCTAEDNWFPYLKRELEKLHIVVVAETLPDNVLARESIWIPFLHDVLKADEHSILVGHSSGAIAAMRYAESHTILGSVLIGSYYTDLGIENEILSGYFTRPWNWDAIQKNQKWILQFSATNDPWIPIREARYVHEKLNTEYYESEDQGHFGGDYYKPEFPELLEALKKKIINYRSLII